MAIDLSALMRALHQRPIAYYPCYADLMGSVAGGVVLSQVLFHYGQEGHKFFKSDKALMAETHVSLREFREAKRQLKNLDFLTVRREGLPAKTWYDVDSRRLAETLSRPSSLNDGVQSSEDDDDLSSLNTVVQTGRNDGVQTLYNDARVRKTSPKDFTPREEDKPPCLLPSVEDIPPQDKSAYVSLGEDTTGREDTRGQYTHWASDDSLEPPDDGPTMPTISRQTSPPILETSSPSRASNHSSGGAPLRNVTPGASHASPGRFSDERETCIIPESSTQNRGILARQNGTSYSPGFLAFWERWHPERRKSKPACFALWQRRELEAQAAAICAHVEALQQTEWRSTEPKYIPLSLTWLNQGRYEDDLPTEDSERYHRAKAMGVDAKMAKYAAVKDEMRQYYVQMATRKPQEDPC